MKITVLGAGGPAGVNALRALSLAGHDLLAVDGNREHLRWCEEFAETMHDSEAWEEHADLYLAQPDVLVLWLAGRPDLPSFLPPKTTIQRCIDKTFAIRRWYQEDLRVWGPVHIGEPYPDHLHFARDTFGMPFWMRANEGAGARAAIAARSLEEAYHWARFWKLRDPTIELIAEQYLPGRDLAWSSIWVKGALITSFARERLEYIYPQLTPEGLTGTPTIARIVHRRDVNEMAEKALRAIDPEPHGIFSVDLKEDEHGQPRPTEVNCRGFTTFGLWSTFETNFLDIAVRAAVGDSGFDLPPMTNALPEGLTLYRHIDCPTIFKRRP